MNTASSLVPTRFLALCLTRLSTDRIRRERLGRSWRSAARPEQGAGAPDDFDPGPVLPVREAAGSAHRAAGQGAMPAGRPAAAASSFAPLAVYGRVGSGYRIEAVCEAAEALGLRPGASLAEARARYPDLDLVEADPAADTRLLAAVADWCDRYTPLVALDETCGLVLDISGCAHLFGGEMALMQDLLQRLAGQGFAATAAIASRAGTARTLVPVRSGIAVAESEAIAAISPLPVTALRLPEGIPALLARLGLTRIGHLLDQPRAGLARRCGAETMVRLDEAAGRLRRPISPRLPVPVLIQERLLFEPVSRQEDILSIAEALSEGVCRELERRCEGARQLELVLFRVDGKVERLQVGTSRPQRDPRRILTLFKERLTAAGDEIDAGFGFDLVKLCVLAADPLGAVQVSLEQPSAETEDIAALLDRLGARLGEVAVFGLEGVESHRPERSDERRSGPCAGSGPGASGDEGAAAVRAPRPLRLFDRPEPVEATAAVPEGAPEQFRWRRALYRVRRVEGPERIASEWWRADAAAGRDYWRVEDEAGRRYWLFREGRYGEADGDLPAVDEAFVETDQDNEPHPATATSHPRWYLHGIFA